MTHVIKSETFPTAELIADWFFVPVAQAKDMLADTTQSGSTYEREIAIGPITHTVKLDSNGIEMFTKD